MAILGTFIGIDKHIDPEIRDLTGARRDATALWALFADTIPEIGDRLFVDGDATVATVRRALDETLGAAGPEDAVIVTFSGHGTHDHRLVLNDTLRADLDSTTISMDELSRHFKESRAKAVLCILDCCFSGGAPARVLDDSPIPRTPTISLESFVGNGRILIAASNIDEEAYELPGTGHGILTKAFLEVMQAGEGSVSLPAAMDKILERTRTEATRIGVSQTPVLFGYVEGGLTFPVLRPGERFYKAFPHARGAHVSDTIDELIAFGLPEKVLTEWSRRFKGKLNDLQLTAVNDHRVLDGESLLVVAPTSSGKTFIGEIAATRAILDGRKAVFLLPYRALVNEKFEQFTGLYGEGLGMRVIRCTGDYSDQTGVFIRGKYDLCLLTYEMFLNLTVSYPSTLNQIGLVVLDEAQFITDPHRGIAVELLLTLLIAGHERGINPQLLALSAVIGNVNDFDAWLGCSKLVTTQRPVPLIEGVLDRSGMFQFIDASGQQRASQLLSPGEIRMRRDKPSAQDVIVPLTRKLVQQGEKIIIFRNQRGPAQGCASYLADELGLNPAVEALNQLPTHDLSSTSETLKGCLNGGTAFHNTNLTREEKVIVEQAFRDPENKVRVLVATTTVAAGINTPASTVVLAEQEFIGEDGRPFTVAEYKNMAGRAGRLGFNEEGKAIILADTGFQRQSLFEKYVLGKPEPIQSSFDLDHIDTWIVRLLAQVKRVRRADVVGLLTNTYGGYLASRSNAKWRDQMRGRLEALLTRMSDLGLVEAEGEYIQLTLLGRACGRSALLFESAMRLVELLKGIDVTRLTPERFMGILQVLPESDGGYTPVMRRGRAEAARQREAQERYGPEIIQAFQRYVSDEFDYFARCKRASVLWDWIQGEQIEVIEQRYSPNPYQGRIQHGDIRRFADVTRFHLRSAHQIASVLYVGQGPSEESIETLLRQLEVGIPVEVLGLLNIPLSLARGEYLALHDSGIRTEEALWALSKDEIKEILGESRTEQLEKIRPSGDK